MQKELKATCPKCQAKVPFVMWESLNVDLNPEMKDSVMDHSLFVITCPECGQKTRIQYPFLYHDMRRRLMIAMAMDMNGYLKDLPEKMKNDLISDGYCNRVVDDPIELTEKIQIFEAGYDDRLVEIAKVIYRMDFMKNKKAALGRIVYENNAEGGRLLMFEKDSDKVYNVGLDGTLLTHLQRDFGSQRGFELTEKFVRVDETWAQRFMMGMLHE